jgi:hypothetical protein
LQADVDVHRKPRIAAPTASVALAPSRLSKALGRTRDRLIKHMSAGRFLQSIVKSMREPL